LRTLRWATDEQFIWTFPDPNQVTPEFSNIEIFGTGENAELRLKPKSEGSEDITFENPSQYIFDPTKIEIINGKAKLKASGTVQDFTFDNQAEYSFDPAKIQISASKAKLVGAPIVPYAWWHLNEISGSTASDSSGNGRNGILVNMEDVDWISGKLNNCLRFDGVNEYINFGNIASFERTQPFSFECWFKTSQVSRFIASKDTGTRGWGIYLAGAGEVAFQLRNENGTAINVKTTTTGFNNNVWRHLTISYDGSGLASGVSIFIDGILQAKTVISDNLNATIINSQFFQVSGRTGTSYCWNGDIDEIVIYDFGVSPSLVTFRYNSGLGIESIPGTYPTNNPSIMNNNGYIFASPLNVFQETATIPSLTGIKYHLSYDNGNTWKYWDGSGWVNTNGTYDQANIASVINANIGSLAGSGTFKFRALLHSDIGDSTPELDNIRITSFTYPIGSFEIEANFDIQPTLVTDWKSVTATVIKPSGTDLKYKYSINSGLIWNPSWLTLLELESDLLSIICRKDGTDKLRVKFLLSTTDNIKTPEIDNLNLKYGRGYENLGYYGSTRVWLRAFYHQIIKDVKIPEGTSLKIYARVIDNVLEGLKINTPFGLGAQYSWIEITENWFGKTGNFFQFLVIMTSNNPSETPRLKKLEVKFYCSESLISQSEAWRNLFIEPYQGKDS